MIVKNNEIIIETQEDLDSINYMILQDDDFNREYSYIKNGKRYYYQTYSIEIDDKENDFSIEVNWEDDSETINLETYVGMKIKIN